MNVQNNLETKGLLAFDNEAAPNIRQSSVCACIEVSIGLLDESDKSKFLSFILYTGIGGSLPSSAVRCLWDVSDEAARSTISLLEHYGLLHTESFKQIPPYFAAAYKFLTVHSVISEYIMSTIQSETVAQLSPFIFLHTEQLASIMTELFFQQSCFSDDNVGFLTYNKQKLEHVIFPHYMKGINMHVLHDPHLALLMLHSIQSCLSDQKYFHLLVTFNAEIVTLTVECQNALLKGRDLSRRANAHFQSCFRQMSFDSLKPIVEEYLESQFIVSTITRCVKLLQAISTICCGDLKVKASTKCKELQLLTKEYHVLSLEKLPIFELYISLYKQITVALDHRNSDQIKDLCFYITTGKLEEEVQLINSNYLIKVHDGEFYAERYMHN